jgi:hypothetical protein
MKQTHPKLTDIKLCPNCKLPLIDCETSEETLHCHECGFDADTPFVIGFMAGAFGLKNLGLDSFFMINPYHRQSEVDNWNLGYEIGSTTYPTPFHISLLSKKPKNNIGYYINPQHQYRVFVPGLHPKRIEVINHPEGEPIFTPRKAFA